MPNRQQAIIWTNDGPVYWQIYASLGLNELTFRKPPYYPWGNRQVTGLYQHLWVIPRTSSAPWGKISGVKTSLGGEFSLSQSWVSFLSQVRFQWHQTILWEKGNKGVFCRLTHCGLEMQYGDIDLGRHWLNHYLNQCWLIISEALWQDNFTGTAKDIYPWYHFKNYVFKIATKFFRGQWVNCWRPRQNYAYIHQYVINVNSLRPSDAHMRQWSNHHWFTNGLSPMTPSQSWNIVKWTLRNKIQWNLNRNSCIIIQENVFRTVVCKMVTILSWPQCSDLNLHIFMYLNSQKRLKKHNFWNIFMKFSIPL